MAQREHTFVLPSGVSCTVRNMVGADYDTLTTQKENDSQFDELTASLILKLGDKKEGFTVNSINKMLSNDRKMILLEARQHTMRHQEEFNFNFEWPLENGKRDVQEYSVKFNAESFPRVPYHWMIDKIKNEAGDDAESIIKNPSEWPVIFESYDQVLAMKEVHTSLPSGDQIVYNLLDGHAENQLALIKKKSINTPLVIRNPRQKLENKKSGDIELMSFDIRRADVYDLEYLRKEIREKEGYIDTTMVIKNLNRPEMQTRVDLLATTSFFFPSQAV